MLTKPKFKPKLHPSQDYSENFSSESSSDHRRRHPFMKHYQAFRSFIFISVQPRTHRTLAHFVRCVCQPLYPPYTSSLFECQQRRLSVRSLHNRLPVASAGSYMSNCFPSLSLRTVCWSAKNSSERTATEDGSHVQCINVTLPLNSPHSSFVFYVGMWKL